MKKTVLITGAAGFIGSITAKKFLRFSNVITIDNLSKGYLEKIDLVVRRRSRTVASMTAVAAYTA